jgi:hypothetical protein
MASTSLSEMLARGPGIVVGSVVLAYVASYLMAVVVALLHRDPVRRADARKILNGNPFSRMGRRR